MQEKVEFEDIRKPSRYDNQWSFPTAAAVGPRGEFVVRHINSLQQAQGDVPIIVIDGLPVISPRYARAGWVLYDDLCHGRAPGIEADEKAWTRWTNLIKLRAGGRDIPAGVLPREDEFFHPEVQRRRATGPGWNAATTIDKALEQMRTMFPGVELTDPRETAKASKKKT